MRANLLGEMAKSKVTIREVADFLGMHRNGISNRIYGRTNFTLDEAISIKRKFFPDKSIEWLFEDVQGLSR